MLGANDVWAAGLVAPFPRRWQANMMREWDRRRASFNSKKVTAQNDAQRAANVALRETVATLAGHAVSDELPLDAQDHDVIAYAQECAEQARVRLLSLAAWQEAGRCGTQAAGITAVELAPLETQEARTMLANFCESRSVKPATGRISDEGAVRRMIAPKWWTMRLRRAHARAVESAAIDFGLVNRTRDVYVSNEGLTARRAQNDRNAQMLESTIARNLDTDQEFTLAELSAKGPANKAIRRAELMTRIAGFERIAIASAHTGLFLTLTCPSKMHAFKMSGARAIRNKRYDGTKPDEAQVYLRGVWARIRASLARRGITLYGFRIAEPQHDGTPHWHLLVFYQPAHDEIVESTVRRYALEMDGDEAGAQEKRCDFKRMDAALGTAAAYIAKYVAKNIDGYKLDKDLIGNDALETSARVEAWASRWRIRQFQQIGGPPVTIWRELRRVESVPADAPAHVRAAHNAVNRVAKLEGRENASVAWDHYVNAQGGVHCGRDYRVRLATFRDGSRTAYGEESAAKPVGIEYFEIAKVRDAIGNWIDVLPRTVTVDSKRYQWEVVRAGSRTQAVGWERALRAPWTRVNNCTRPAVEPDFQHHTAAPFDDEFDGAAMSFAGGGAICTDRRPE
ncbi:bacteriophage replication gene A protein [Paraburkholderia eburnea]|uniref:Bacteriophage replication gene A protein n=1 Tax=Paraburkholderia eburnea TaxID=1189126 RepID=A0A2S4LWA1_9BURK|nr:replication endonuclease [Paraburkholderia eburnea]POR46724.1 bacteriophage replication gene A protein [Paraburkholderia eburnea]PRZ17913.1 bacteriophage replication gene A protein [Paraburkholderia eburnea]